MYPCWHSCRLLHFGVKESYLCKWLPCSNLKFWALINEKFYLLLKELYELAKRYRNLHKCISISGCLSIYLSSSYIWLGRQWGLWDSIHGLSLRRALSSLIGILAPSAEGLIRCFLGKRKLCVFIVNSVRGLHSMLFDPRCTSLRKLSFFAFSLSSLNAYQIKAVNSPNPNQIISSLSLP